MQPNSATGKKRVRCLSDAGDSSDDVPTKKKIGRTRQRSTAQIASTILQKYKDDALAGCNLQKYPEFYEQVKAHVLKASMAPSGNKIGEPSTQLPYGQLQRLLNHGILDIPASLAEAVRIMCPSHKFTPALIAQMISLGWDPALICHPTKSAKQRLAASKEEQMEKHKVDQADVDKYEDALILRKRLAGVGKRGSLDGYVDPDLDMIKQAQDISITLHVTNLQDQLTALQRQLTEINKAMAEAQRQSSNTHQTQIFEAQSQLTKTDNKTHLQSIDTYQSQMAEMQRQLTATHQMQMAEMQRQLTSTHETQMTEVQRQLTTTHQSQMSEMQRHLTIVYEGQIAEMQRHLTATHQSQMSEMRRHLTSTSESQIAEIRRHLVRLIPSSPAVPDAASSNVSGRTLTDPDPSA